MNMRALRRGAFLMVAVLPILATLPGAAETEKRAFSVEDFYRLKSPSGLDLSPDGDWLVYSLRSTDLREGKASHDLYRVGATGSGSRRLTWSEDAPVSTGELLCWVVSGVSAIR